MAGKEILFVILILMSFSLVSAGINSDYYVFGDDVLSEIEFENVSELELRLPYDSEAIDVKGLNESYEIKERDGYKLFIVDLEDREDFELSYVSSFYTEETPSRNYFQIENFFKEKQNISVHLPEGAVLEDEGMLFPEPSKITSDGKKVILKYKNYDSEQLIVSYKSLKKESNFWFFLIFGLVVLFGILFYSQRKKFREKLKKKQKKEKRDKKKKEKEITKNLLKEEKEIAEYLFNKKGKESWTKNISKDLGIGKVKLSRKLRNLEEKGIIEKTPYGNENKIKLKT